MSEEVQTIDIGLQFFTRCVVRKSHLKLHVGYYRPLLCYSIYVEHAVVFSIIFVTLLLLIQCKRHSWGELWQTLPDFSSSEWFYDGHVTADYDLLH